VRSSRRQAISATVESATNQLGDTRRSTRRQFISCLSLYIFRVLRYRQIHFGTPVVQRYYKFCDPIHSSPYMVPPHTCPTVPLNTSNTVPKLPLTVLDSLPIRRIPVGELTTRKWRQLAPAEVVRVRVRIEES